MYITVLVPQVVQRRGASEDPCRCTFLDCLLTILEAVEIILSPMVLLPGRKQNENFIYGLSFLRFTPQSNR